MPFATFLVILLTFQGVQVRLRLPAGALREGIPGAAGTCPEAGPISQRPDPPFLDGPC